MNNSNGYDSLLLNFTEALEDNSKIIGDALQALTERELSNKDKKELKKIQKELKSIDRGLSGIK